MRALLAALALASLAHADVTRPAYLGLTETAPGRFEVLWRVPRRGDRVLALRVRLPAAMRATSEPTIELTPDGQAERWTVRAEPWALRGTEIAFEGPGKARVDTMVRFQFRDGRVVARVLPPGTPGCAFPARALAPDPARALQGATVGGLRHVATSGAHLAFVLALALCGPVRTIALALLFFLAGQVAGLVLPVPEPYAEALLGVAAAVLAAAAWRGSPARPYAIAALGGLAHGSVLGGGPLAVAGTLVGVDAASLLVGVAGALALRRRAAYPVGVAGVLFAALAIGAERAPPAAARADNVLLAPVAAPAGGTAPVAAARDAPVRLFLDVGPWETRVECVAKLSALGLTDASTVGIPAQEELKRRVGELFERHFEIAVAAPRRTLRVDFLVRDAGSLLERVAPVEEDAAEALLGVACSYPTATPPERVAVRWTPLPGIAEVPATIVDPESTRSARLSAADRELVWSGTIAEPRIRAVTVRRPTLPLSWASLGCVAAALLLLRRSATAARLLVAGACLVAPYAPLEVPLPLEAEPSPEAFASLLTNVYRSLELTDESAAYDRLGTTVTEDALPAIYLDQRRMLELGRRGGARVRADSVEVMEIGAVEALGDGRVRATAVWEAGGFVVHFGHRHYRLNRYDASLELVSQDGRWKIARLDVRDKRRTR